MSVASLPLLDAFSVLSDQTRCRMLWLIDGQELTVTDLCAVIQAPQSTVSRHLKTLSDAGWVASRRDGTSRYYSLVVAGHDAAKSQIWALTRDQLKGRPGVDQDWRRLKQVLASRGETSQQFFATSAGQWDRLRDELFGREALVSAMLGLLPPDWTVGDLGCGTGAAVAMLAPHVGTVIGVDGSEEMLASARARLGGMPNVDLRCGTLESLPIDDRALDAAVMTLVLHHLPSPALAIEEASRVLKPGGRLLIVDMTPHEREEYRQQMGHVWLGFSDDQVRRMMEQAGFRSVRINALPPATEAKGPSLFAATAVR